MEIIINSESDNEIINSIKNTSNKIVKIYNQSKYHKIDLFKKILDFDFQIVHVSVFQNPVEFQFPERWYNLNLKTLIWNDPCLIEENFYDLLLEIIQNSDKIKYLSICTFDHDSENYMCPYRDEYENEFNEKIKMFKINELAINYLVNSEIHAVPVLNNHKFVEASDKIMIDYDEDEEFNVWYCENI